MMEHLDNYEYLVQGPNMARRESFVRLRPPQPARQSRKAKRPTTGPGGVRQRRNKHWNW